MANYYAIGAALNSLVNMSSYFKFSPKSVRNAQPAPLRGLVRRASLSGRGRADGFINSALTLDFSSQAQYEAFIWTIFGGFETENVQKYMTLFDASGHFSPFYGWIGQPTINWETSDALTNVVFPLTDLTLQTVTKTNNASVTTSERLVYVDTSGGDRTMTLPAVAGVTANTVYSYIKTASANSMILDGNSSETINGATTLTKTAQYARVDIVYDGSQWVTI